MYSCGKIPIMDITYENTKIKPATKKNLKLIMGATGESAIDILDRIVREELVRQSQVIQEIIRNAEKQR
jgi:hypothetical protein